MTNEMLDRFPQQPISKEKIWILSKQRRFPLNAAAVKRRIVTIVTTHQNAGLCPKSRSFCCCESLKKRQSCALNGRLKKLIINCNDGGSKAIAQKRAEQGRILHGHAERKMNVKYEGISCQWHCPNCGALVQGIKNGDGIAKGECRSCGSSMVRKFMGRRHDRLDVYAPKGQESVYA